jgi:hypothetical protein
VGGRPSNSPAWPTSRTLLAWWREIEGFGPARLWVSHLQLQRVEGLVAVRHRQPLDPLTQAILFSLLPDSPTPLAVLAGRLGLEVQILGRWLNDLAATGLAAEDAAGWVILYAGQEALAAGAMTTTAHERRTFSFLDRTDAGLPPHFFPLPAATPLPPGQDLPFDVAVLQECILRPPAWKARYGFPADVADVILPGTLASDVSDWKRVVLVQGGQQMAVLVEVGKRLLVFAVQVPGWVLRREKPLVEFAEGWEEVFAAAATPLPLAAWSQAWQGWCQPRGLPRGEAEGCRLTWQGLVLRVDAPPRLVDRLRASNSDAVKGEAWLLAGNGSTRAVAKVELREAAPE